MISTQSNFIFTVNLGWTRFTSYVRLWDSFLWNVCTVNRFQLNPIENGSFALISKTLNGFLLKFVHSNKLTFFSLIVAEPFFACFTRCLMFIRNGKKTF